MHKRTSFIWAILVAVFAPVLIILLIASVHEAPGRISTGPSREVNSVGSADPAFEMQIVPVGGIPSNDEQEIRLKARILVKVPLSDDLSFHWQLPESVHVVSGETEDSFANVHSGQIVEIEISLLGLSKETRGRTVVLEVNSGAHGYRLNSSAIFSVTPEAVQVPASIQE